MKKIILGFLLLVNFALAETYEGKYNVGLALNVDEECFEKGCNNIIIPKDSFSLDELSVKFKM